MTRRILLIAVVVAALLGGSLLVYDVFGPKSDRERIEDACGPHALDESNTEPAYIGDDGTICCGGLCGTTQSA